MKLYCLSFLTLTALVMPLCAEETKSPTKPAIAQPAQSVLADCISWNDRKLTVKFRADDGQFKSYIAANFTYPRQGGLLNAKVGESYVITFAQGEAAHNVKTATLLDPAKPSREIPEDSMIAKVVGLKEKDNTDQPLEPNKQGVIVQFVQDENVEKFFARDQTFPIYAANREFSPGQVIKITFGPDNRHCSGYKVVGEK